MNREQRRKYEKSLRSKGISSTDAKNIVSLKQKIDSTEPIPEGSKVRLDIDVIKNDPNYERKVDRYKQFVDENKDKTFTVEYDARHKNKPLIVCLKEDTSLVKWLWSVEELVQVDG